MNPTTCLTESKNCQRSVVFTLRHLFLDVLLLSFFIWLPCTSGAPVTKLEEALTEDEYQLMEDELEEAAIFDPVSSTGNVIRPIWVNPCGVEDVKADQDAPLQSVPEAVTVPLLEVSIALRHSRQLTNEFAQKAFRANLDDVVRTWSHIRYDWLPGEEFNHKTLGNSLNKDFIDSLKFESAVKEMYVALQKVAVGLEQVILDQAVYGGDYLTEFKETELKLRMVLCSLQSAMIETGVMQNSDAARQVMAREYRDLHNPSARNLRDFIILREYTNILEYAQQVLEHFKTSS